MARFPSSRSGPLGEPDIVITVVRGQTEEGTRTFKRGQASPPISVGSHGDWSVSGPGVVPIHLWLSFDGQRLLAASADGSASLRGRPLGSDASPLREGDELRLGFALLRVGSAATRAKPRPKSRSLPAPVVWGIAAA